MTRGLDHLPAPKQHEIERIVGIVLEEFDDAVSLSTRKWKTNGKILKIVLFGSHARGDWSYEPGTPTGKVSDWDLLIVVNDDRLTNYREYWSNLGKRLRLEFERTHRLVSPVQFIVHSLGEVNDALAHGRYFFTDIIRDGIVLHDTGDASFTAPATKQPGEALAAANQYFETWYTKATEFFETFQFSREKGRLENAAFQLHQSVERLYQTVLLVSTLYTPYVHDLVKLRGQAERIDDRLRDAWPRERAEDVDAFELLQQAYVKARYLKDFSVDADTLDWLAARSEILIGLVGTLCKERLDALADAAR